MDQADEPEVVRFYTSTRRFPKLIGRLPSGESLPGGPYTVSQLVWGIALLVLVAKTKGAVWSTDNAVTDLAIMLGLPMAVAWGIGRLPWDVHNPLLTLMVLPSSWGAPQGTYRGEVVSLPRPHTVRGRVRLDLATPTLRGPDPEPPVEQLVPTVAPSPAEPEPGTSRTGAPLSAVQSLLAGAAQRS